MSPKVEQIERFVSLTKRATISSADVVVPVCIGVSELIAGTLEDINFASQVFGTSFYKNRRFMYPAVLLLINY